MKRPYHHALSLAMARLLFERRRERLLEQQADIVVPIPMHWSRRIGRGINNPDIVGQCLAKSLGIPLRRDILIRRVNTTPQADLPPSRRFENVRGVFGVRRLEAVAGARILLVDDVLTTGATCSEAAKVLKRAGASAVAVTVIARAQGK
jgi:ComF family protein